MGLLPLAVEIRVMVIQNFDVDGGVVNGSIGILKCIRYRTDAHGNRHTISCAVGLDNYDNEPMAGLQRGEVPVMREKCSFTV
ncbi:hypothetical protein CERSUDRAFT_37571, partial [Gelatoporia subvermispora B]